MNQASELLITFHQIRSGGFLFMINKGLFALWLGDMALFQMQLWSNLPTLTLHHMELWIWLGVHWNLFLRVKFPMNQHWFISWLATEQATSHCLNPCWRASLAHICGTRSQSTTWSNEGLVPWRIYIRHQNSKCYIEITRHIIWPQLFLKYTVTSKTL